jgi:hypothetical protein
MKRSKKNIPKGFDSWLEYDLSKQLKRCSYHPDKIEYTQVRNYEPDFVFEEYGFTTYIEVKGRFRTRDEARKYVDVRNSLGKNETLVFIFQNPHTAMPFARKRADGSRYTMAEWAKKHDFEYYSPDTVPPMWSRKK